MIIHITQEALAKCKEMVQKFMKSRSDFKEIGGYLIGIYDGDFKITKFLLDTNAESTATRIKLSAECFQQVEQILTQETSLMYVGTWHVHPGKTKPIFSHTDESTLFLEKLVLKTDNPKEYLCPRIHLIFSQDLMLISAYTMKVNIDYTYSDYWKLDKKPSDDNLERIDQVIKNLQNIKKGLTQYKKSQDLNILDAVFSELGNIRGDIDHLLDIIEDISDNQEIFQIITKDRENIEKQLKSKIKDGASLGLIVLNPEEKLDFIDYLPNLIEENQKYDTLLGFWRHYSIKDPPIELHEIFYANFYIKIEANLRPSYLYIVSDPTGFTFFNLKLFDFTGISFKEVEIIY